MNNLDQTSNNTYSNIQHLETLTSESSTSQIRPFTESQIAAHFENQIIDSLPENSNKSSQTDLSARIKNRKRRCKKARKTLCKTVKFCRKKLKVKSQRKVQSLTLNDGSLYKGETKNNLPHGKGIISYQNGDKYIGKFKQGLRHSHGFSIIEDETPTDECKSQYLGEFKDDQFHGAGSYKFSNGDLYVGYFENGVFQGFGKFIQTVGVTHEGLFKNDKFHGEGMQTYIDGLTLKGVWKRDTFIKDQNFNFFEFLSNESILKLILGLDTVPPPHELPLLIVIDFLSYAKFTTEAELLNDAYELLLQPPQKAAQKVFHKIQETASKCLICYGFSEHAMGLQITNTGTHLQISVFNSGIGLEYHKHKRIKKTKKIKLQTRKDYYVKTQTLSEKTIKQLILSHKFSTSIKKAYNKIQKLNDSQKTSSDNSNSVWQSPQKSDNCTLEWIFAYLKNSLEPIKYLTLRKKFFETCLKALDINKTISPENKQAYKKELIRKIEKRKLKIENLH